MQKEQRGFTLIELLIVIATIGLLASIVAAGVNNARKSAKDARRMQDRKSISTALALYYNEHGGYPGSGSNWTCFGAPSSESCWNGGYYGNDTLKNQIQPFISGSLTTNADGGTYAFNRYLYVFPACIEFQCGAYLIWPKENPMAAQECNSQYPIQHYDKYYYCYEFIGSY